MLRSLKDLDRFKVSATDGDIGRVENILFDDERWAVRYLVVEIGVYRGAQPVLISPVSFREVDWSVHRFHVALTLDQIKSSPSVDVDKPVSRWHEQEFYRYYRCPPYWGSTSVWGMFDHPNALASREWNEVPAEHSDKTSGDIHLRSANEVRGYQIQGSDGSIGHVEDFIVDDETWEIRYLVIDTSDWWFGKKVLVAPHWANRISWEEGNVYLDLSREKIKSSPEWNATAAVNREYEARLYDHYGRPIYWAGDDHPKEAQSPLHKNRL